MGDQIQYGDEGLDLPELIEKHARALTIPDLAGYMACSDKQLYKLAAAGLLPHYRIGSLIRLSPRETAQWLRSRRVGLIRVSAEAEHLHQAIATCRQNVANLEERLASCAGTPGKELLVMMRDLQSSWLDAAEEQERLYAMILAAWKHA